AQAILDMRLARLTGLERDKLQAEYDDLQKSIAYFRSLLADESLLMGVIKDEMPENSNKFADPRRTEVTVLEVEVEFGFASAPDGEDAPF
ncbi:DNA gyrase subunit A, partial [Bacteroides sp.]